jgi:hypothetical protein
MIKLIRRARLAAFGLAVAATMTLGVGGAIASQEADKPPVPVQQCFERAIPEPINEAGIQCIGDPDQPAIWKSYTYASDGFGYYVETDNFGQVPYVSRVAYIHRDGRVAISMMVCNQGGCDVQFWNEAPFPYDEKFDREASSTT